MDAEREGEREITSRASVGKSEGVRFPEGSRGRKSALAMKARKRGGETESEREGLKREIDSGSALATRDER